MAGGVSENIKAHAILLAARGCVSDALALIQSGIEAHSLDESQAWNLLGYVARLPQAQLPSDHQIFGIFQDSVISSLHFRPLTDHAQAREAFRQAVRWIEIETSSQCNRHCSYCPNNTFDRRSANDFLDLALYSRIVRDLSEIGYDGRMSFVGNNEFFMHRENRQYVELARTSLPRAVLKLYTNGDFLEKADLAWASSIDVGLIHVALHAAPTRPYDDGEALRRAHLFQQQTGLSLQLVDFVQGHKLTFIARCGRTKVFVRAQNMQESGHNWNGLVKSRGIATREATDPCSYPLRQFVVSHDGDLLLCCMTFKERIPENDASGARVGDLAAYPSIFAAYASPRMAAWRRAVFRTAAKSAPCVTCPGLDGEEAKAASVADQVHELLALWEHRAAPTASILAGTT